MVDRTFHIGGEYPIDRMGFGAMRLTGPGVWGPPQDVAQARAVLRRAVALGVNFIDTADVYGPGDNERLIRDALQPYASGLVIASKAGLVRTGPATQGASPSVNGTEAHIRGAIENSLRDLGLRCITLYQLHRVDPAVPIEHTMRVFRSLRDEGKIRHIGLSEVEIEEIERARSVVEIATVQNRYNLLYRKHDDVLAYCGRHGIGFIPFYPLGAGELARSVQLQAMADRVGATTGQLALAWLLQKSPVTILIPGTSSVPHLEQNMAAGEIVLSQADMIALDQLKPMPGA